MLQRIVLCVSCACLMFWAVVAADNDAIPVLKFNDVREIAPGVFFRYASISATDSKVPFGGCNNTWVVFKDYVVVIDANFPKEASDVIAAIRQTTDKPIKYVLDTHHHGDHAYGNKVWSDAGAKIIGSRPSARLLEANGPKQWAMAADGREDIKNSQLKTVDISFDDKYVLDDGAQRVEFLHFGHAHTPGDSVAWLPRHKILCTGDACVNGAFNFMGHSNSASWIRYLDKLQEIDVKLICPGHGPLANKELLGKQKRYFVDLRREVKKGIDDGKTAEDIVKTVELPWYEEWTGKPVRKNVDNVMHVYQELMGKIDHQQLGQAPANDDWGSMVRARQDNPPVQTASHGDR